MTPSTSSPGVAAAPLGMVDKVVAVPAGVMLLGVGALGAWVSFHNVRTAMEPSFGGLAWAVPVAVDLGIFLFTALDLLLTRLRLRPVWLRFVPWGLIACTIYLNIEPSLGKGDTRGAVGHMVVPAIWVIAVEVTAGIVRRVAGLTESDDARRARGRMDRVRLSRWLLAPVSTALLWRRMVLWETRSYREALGRERDRLLARTHLQDTHGPIKWRWQAKRRDRALYRLGELTPTSLGEPAPETSAAPPPAVGTGAGSAITDGTGGEVRADRMNRQPRSHGASQPVKTPQGRGGVNGAEPTSQRFEDLSDGEQLQVGLRAAREVEGQDKTLSGPALGEVIRGWGYRLSNGRRQILVKEVRAARDSNGAAPAGEVA